MQRLPVLLLAFLTLVLSTHADDLSLPPGIRNSQDPKDAPPTPQAALKKITVPEGFEVTLFAGEPHVRQPIAMAIDDRGRLWVAECYSYRTWKAEGRDRILILEDTDGDGVFDSRKVFWDKGNYLTGLQLGFGGVWICSAPNFLFIPDRDGDDVPDGKPEVLLDGWSTKGVHNVPNGLTWGPDGWLYGCNGITAPSKVGRPGTPEQQRTDINCGIWRYHPTRHEFEIVAHGTTNPWGLDYDQHGQFFFTNCVIGHLWHLIPGAHYKRMFGQDFNPHTYELIDQCADHLHWAGKEWTKSRGGKGEHDALGGGHAHCGAMIYLGDNWPDRYRGRIFTCNVHGNRVNCDVLERQGSGYVGRHGKDLLFANDPWFRGVELKYGARGEVYIADWTELGECHDKDGVHRDSGRIFRVTYGAAKLSPASDLARAGDVALASAQKTSENAWRARHARRIMQERTAAGSLDKDAHETLLKTYQDVSAEGANVRIKLRALWALHVTGGASKSFLMRQLGDPSEHIRWWAVRLLCEDKQAAAEAAAKLALMAKSDESALVRLGLASALQRLPLDKRWAIAENLVSHEEDVKDQNLPLMIWYGIEPLVGTDARRALRLTVKCKFPQIRQYVARRLAENQVTAVIPKTQNARTHASAAPAAWVIAGLFVVLSPRPTHGEEPPSGLSALVQLLGDVDDAELHLDLLSGMHQALEGRRNVKMPAGWQRVYPRLANSDSAAVRDKALHLALVFGDADAVAQLRTAMMDRRSPRAARLRAIGALTQYRVPGAAPLLQQLLNDEQVRGAALRGLAAYDDKSTPRLIVERYASLTAAEKNDAIQTLASRAGYAVALLDAIEAKKIPAGDVSAFAARQVERLGDEQISRRLRNAWGDLRDSSGEKKKLIASYRGEMSPQEMDRADLVRGRAVFEKTCMNCHRLYGEGGTIGPDITGGNRDNLDYLLENILDPSASVARDYRVTNVYTLEGRIVSGIVLRDSVKTITIQTINERIVLDKSEIEDIETSQVSMMPDGLVEKLSKQEFRDLLAYLASKKRVEPPGKTTGS